MTDEYKPRPQKRSEDFSHNYSRLQALLLTHGAARRDIDGIPKINYSHPLTKRCQDWMERAAGTNSQPDVNTSSLSSNGSDRNWQTLKRNLSPQAMSRLVEHVEKLSGVSPFDESRVSELEPDEFLLDQCDFLDEVDRLNDRC